MSDMTIIMVFALLLCLLSALCISSCSGTGEGNGTVHQTVGGEGSTVDNTGDSTGETTTGSVEITTAAAETTGTAPVTVTLRAASYNIKHGADAGLDMTVIGNIIKSANLDIVGIQEVDYLNTRSNGMDEPKLIAEAAEMPYYKFARSIDYKGGQYGTLILSKYPITEFTVHRLNSGSSEQRTVGHAVLDINGISVDFLNTHLSYESDKLRAAQFVQLQAIIEKCDYYIITGDFNTQIFTEFKVLGAPLMINRTGSFHVTYPSSSSGIDNIVLSDGWRELSAGTVEKSYSDHRMLWAELELTGIPD